MTMQPAAMAVTPLRDRDRPHRQPRQRDVEAGRRALESPPGTASKNIKDLVSNHLDDIPQR